MKGAQISLIGLVVSIGLCEASLGENLNVNLLGRVRQCRSLVKELNRHFVAIADLSIVWTPDEEIRVATLHQDLAPPLKSDSLILDSSIIKSLDRFLLSIQADSPVLMVDLHSEFTVKGKSYQQSDDLPLPIFIRLGPQNPLRQREVNRRLSLPASSAHRNVALNFGRNAPPGAFDLYQEAYALVVATKVDPRVSPLLQKMRAAMASFYFGHQLVVTPQTAFEDLKFVPNGYVPRVVTAPVHDHPDFTEIQQRLIEARVGMRGSKPELSDVINVAEAILAPREEGAVPTFVTSDGGVYNRLIRVFFRGPNRESEVLPVVDKFPHGFLIEVPTASKVYSLKILPISTKPPTDVELKVIRPR